MIRSRPVARHHHGSLFVEMHYRLQVFLKPFFVCRLPPCPCHTLGNEAAFLGNIKRFHSNTLNTRNKQARSPDPHFRKLGAESVF